LTPHEYRAPDDDMHTVCIPPAQAMDACKVEVFLSDAGLQINKRRINKDIAAYLFPVW
jgi:hypothetical protein